MKSLILAILAITSTLGISHGQDLRIVTANADGLVSPDADGMAELKGSPAAPRNSGEFDAKVASVGEYIARLSPDFVGIQDIDPSTLTNLASKTTAAEAQFLGNSTPLRTFSLSTKLDMPGYTLGAMSGLKPEEWSAGAPYVLDKFTTTASYFIIPVTRTPNPTHILWLVVARYHADEKGLMAALFAEIDKRAAADTTNTIGIVVCLSGADSLPDLPNGWVPSATVPFGTKYNPDHSNTTADWLLAGGAAGLRNSQVGGLALSIAQITPDSVHSITRHQFVYADIFFK